MAPPKPPPIRVAIVAGTAQSLWADLALCGPLEQKATIFAVNDAGQFLPRVDHIVSLHGDYPGLMRTVRVHRDVCHREHHVNIVTHSLREAPGVDRVWTLPSTGSSSMLAVRIALVMDFDKIICAGVPIDASLRFHDDPRKAPVWDYGEAYRAHWITAAREEFDGRVRSCSGWTRELLGGPDPAWLTAPRHRTESAA